MRFPQNLRFTRSITRSIKNLCALCVLSIVVFAGVAMANFWEKKLYDQWNQKEVEKMLTDSPWAKELNLQSSADSFSGSAMDSQPPYINYTVQLRSVGLVRQAVVRQA